MVDELLPADDVAAPHGVGQVVDDLVHLDDGAGGPDDGLERLRKLEVLAGRVHGRGLPFRLRGLRQSLV